jgi:hypothetical protein
MTIVQVVKHFILCSAWALMIVSAFRRCHAPRSKRQYVMHDADENLSFESPISTLRISTNRRGDRGCFKDFWEASYATVSVSMGTS